MRMIKYVYTGSFLPGIRQQAINEKPPKNCIPKVFRRLSREESLFPLPTY
jgi:hypothetical protein